MVTSSLLRITSSENIACAIGSNLQETKPNAKKRLVMHFLWLGLETDLLPNLMLKPFKLYYFYLMTNKLVSHFIDLFDSLIGSVQDPTLREKLFHEFDMTQNQDGNRVFQKSISGLVSESFCCLDVTAAPLVAIITSNPSLQGNMSQHPVYRKSCILL